MPKSDGLEPVNADMHVREIVITTGNFEILSAWRPATHEHGIEPECEQFLHAGNRLIETQIHSSVGNHVDLFTEYLCGQTEGGYVGAHQAAGFALLFTYRHFIAERQKIIGNGERGATGSNAGDALAVFTGGQRWQALDDLTFLIGCRALQTADGHWLFVHPPAATSGKNLEIPGRYDDLAHVHIGIDWLESVAFGHVSSIGRNVLIIGAGNTAMDCCRTSLRLGGANVKVMARKPLTMLKASDWEMEEAMEENVEIILCHAPKDFVLEDKRIRGLNFEILAYREEDGKLLSEVVGSNFLPADDIILAIGQENAFPWIERDIGLAFDRQDVPVVDRRTMQGTLPGVFFGGDAAFGPENIIWAVEHGHQAAISIHKYCQGEDIHERPAATLNLTSAKMGIHEWSYSNRFDTSVRRVVPHVSLSTRFKNINIEVELGFTPEQTQVEVERCLNCDIQTVFFASKCIECDACIDVCPTECLTLAVNGEEDDLRKRLKVPADNRKQLLFVSSPLPQTGRVMVKDEDQCVHCGLCAERCPTAAWDMQKSTVKIPYALDGPAESVPHPGQSHR